MAIWTSSDDSKDVSRLNLMSEATFAFSKAKAGAPALAASLSICACIAAVTGVHSAERRPAVAPQLLLTPAVRRSCRQRRSQHSWSRHIC